MPQKVKSPNEHDESNSRQETSNICLHQIKTNDNVLSKTAHNEVGTKMLLGLFPSGRTEGKKSVHTGEAQYVKQSVTPPLTLVNQPLTDNNWR